MSEAVHHVIKVVTLHELAHNFGHMPHNRDLDKDGNPVSVVWVPRENSEEAIFVRVPLKFVPDEIKRIHQTTHP